MARKPVKVDNALLSTLKALEEVSQGSIGRAYEKHVLLKNNWATVVNDKLSGGIKIEQDFLACPQLDMMVEALAKCGHSINYTQLDNGRLSIKSEKFKAIVPCLNPDDMPIPFPDQPIAPLDDRLKAAVQAVAPLSEEGEESIVTASILLHNGSATATDRNVIIEYWHGIDLPPMLALPKAVIAPLIKSQKKLTQFGYSNSSCTFHYEDGSWLKSAFFAERWPDVSRVLDVKAACWPLPEGFYAALKALERFSDDGNVYFDSGIMRSHKDPEVGASYELYGLPKGPIMSIKQLKMIEPYVKKIDFMATNAHGNPIIIWFGDMCRGAIAGRK